MTHLVYRPTSLSDGALWALALVPATIPGMDRSPSDWWHLPWVDTPTSAFLVAGPTPGLWRSRPGIANKQVSQPFVLGWTLEGAAGATRELALSHRGSQFA